MALSPAGTPVPAPGRGDSDRIHHQCLIPSREPGSDTGSDTETAAPFSRQQRGHDRYQSQIFLHQQKQMERSGDAVYAECPNGVDVPPARASRLRWAKAGGVTIAVLMACAVAAGMVAAGRPALRGAEGAATQGLAAAPNGNDSVDDTIELLRSIKADANQMFETMEAWERPPVPGHRQFSSGYDFIGGEVKNFPFLDLEFSEDGPTWADSTGRVFRQPTGADFTADPLGLTRPRRTTAPIRSPSVLNDMRGQEGTAVSPTALEVLRSDLPSSSEGMTVITQTYSVFTLSLLSKNAKSAKLSPFAERALAALPRTYTPETKPIFTEFIKQFGLGVLMKTTLGGTASQVAYWDNRLGLSDATLSEQARIDFGARIGHSEHGQLLPEYDTARRLGTYRQTGGVPDKQSFEEWRASIASNPVTVDFEYIPLADLVPDDLKSALAQATTDALGGNDNAVIVGNTPITVGKSTTWGRKDKYYVQTMRVNLWTRGLVPPQSVPRVAAGLAYIDADHIRLSIVVQNIDLFGFEVMFMAWIPDNSPVHGASASFVAVYGLQDAVAMGRQECVAKEFIKTGEPRDFRACRKTTPLPENFLSGSDEAKFYHMFPHLDSGSLDQLRVRAGVSLDGRSGVKTEMISWMGTYMHAINMDWVVFNERALLEHDIVVRSDTVPGQVNSGSQTVSFPPAHDPRVSMAVRGFDVYGTFRLRYRLDEVTDHSLTARVETWLNTKHCEDSGFRYLVIGSAL